MRPATVIAAAVVAVTAGCGGPAPVMTAADALDLPRPEPDLRISYAPGALQFGELRLPAVAGPHPVALVVHGGCWLAAYDLGYISGLAAALTGAGVATWSVEYRRVGDDGGGWPGTFDDVAAAADHLVAIAAEHDLDLDRTVAVGHSAGGHLALWLAGRHRLAADDPLRGPAPLPISGVVALAGIADLAAYAAPEGCGAAVPDLLDAHPSEVPARVARTSPVELVPLGVPQTLIIGALDEIVPAAQARDYRAAAVESGDTVTVVDIPSAGHFELIDPTSAAWPTVRDAVLNHARVSTTKTQMDSK